MPFIESGGLKIEVDDQGFLVKFEDWNEKVACALAEQEGVSELTKERMSIVTFIRDYYKEFKSMPILRAVCKNIHQPKECVTEQFIDPLKAWKIAGLPNPGVFETESADESGKIYRMLVPD
jgi:tRNA 2-thiouridine synthesizing protein E